MAKVNIITRDGSKRCVEGSDSEYLMEAIRNDGIDEIQGLCGGQLSCSTCHVYVDPAYADRLPPMTDDEDELLRSSDYRKSESRLSCQIFCNASIDGMTVEIAPEN